MRIAILVILLMGLSFAGGFWWEHGKLRTARYQLKSTTAQLSAAESTVQLCRLQDQLLMLVGETGNKNYGEAAALSTKFFNDLGDAVSRTSDPNLKSAMQSILAKRDEATADLAKGDPASHDLFSNMAETLDGALSKSGSGAATIAQ